VSSTTEETLKLRAVASRKEGLSDDSCGPDPALAEAKGAVPLLWLSLFEYDDVEVRQVGGVEVFAGVTGTETAVTRLRTLKEVLPGEPEALRGSTEILRKEVEQAAKPFVALYPLVLFGQMRPADGRAYLRQLVNLCDLWERTRAGLAWEETESQLERVSANISKVFAGDDQQMVCYTLIGSLAQKWSALRAGHFIDDSLRVSVGQEPDDTEPEAVAVGEQGLILGRFDGVWKLMSSSCEKDLLAVSGEGDVAWAVGGGGQVAQLSGGLWSRLKVPTEETLNTVWVMNRDTVCVAGDRGTVLVLTGSEWRPWAVPTQGSIRCIWGTGPENICLATEEPVVHRYDGYSWQRMPLPDEGSVAAFGVLGGKIIAVGSSRRGGELFVLDRSGWTNDTRLPRTEWLEGLWRGWSDEVGVMLQTGEALIQRDGAWSRERLPVDTVSSVDGGSVVVATGRAGKHTVVVCRSELGWQVEAALSGLKLNAVWVAGRPKPPRLAIEPPTAAGGEGGSGVETSAGVKGLGHQTAP
jgi:hypothetical protein